MFHSIFQKHIIFFVGVLIVSTTLLSVTIAYAFNEYFFNHQKKLLYDQSLQIASSLTMEFSTGTDLDKIDYDLQYDANSLEHFLGINFMYVNNSFRVLIASPTLQQYTGTYINTDGTPLSNISHGKPVDFVGNLNGLYPSKELIVAVPVQIKQNGTVYNLGSMIASSPMSQIDTNIFDILFLVGVCLFLSMIVDLVLIFFFSRSFSKPLHEMSLVAEEISHGNFKKRLEIHSKDEVGQLADSLNNMADSLYMQDNMRQEFISNISHDLRSPLTSMNGFLHAIVDGTVPEEKQDHYLQIVMDETNRLTKLTNDILDANKTQDLKVELNKTIFDMNSMIRETATMFEARVLDKNINLTLNFADSENYISADREKIQRVIYNLIDNSLKFVSNDGNISIETSIEGNYVRISVKDDGPGITPEDQKRIFDRFYKVDSSRGKDKMGSGIGLAIVKSFVVAHGDNIVLKSEVGKGSEFSFKLPKIAEK